MSSAPPAARPFVHVNFAVDADGSVEGAAPISSAADWRRVHCLRERYDAVAIGARTWALDRPLLTVRRERLGREPRRQPHRVIFGGRGPCAVLPDGRPTFLIGSAGAAGREMIPIPARDHLLAGPLGKLFEHGVRSLLVEGGPVLLRSFFAQGFCDRLTVFVPTGCAESAARAAGRVLPGLPPLGVHRFGNGVLLDWRADRAR